MTLVKHLVLLLQRFNREQKLFAYIMTLMIYFCY